MTVHKDNEVGKCSKYYRHQISNSYKVLFLSYNSSLQLDKRRSGFYFGSHYFHTTVFYKNYLCIKVAVFQTLVPVGL